MYGHVITKFSRMVSLAHYLIHGAPLRALRARELCNQAYLNPNAARKLWSTIAEPTATVAGKGHDIFFFLSYRAINEKIIAR